MVLARLVTGTLSTLMIRRRAPNESRIGVMADCMDRDELDELMREVAKGQERESPPARVLPFPPGDLDDDGPVH